MQTKIMKALRGMTEGVDLDAKLALIREAGYAGLECAIPDIDAQAFKDLRSKHRLDYVGMVFADDSVSFRKQCEALLPYEPLLINAHTSRDKVSFEEGCAFYREAVRIEKDLPVAVAHETHRRRAFFAPWTTAAYLKEFPELRICADFSHWCCVCESLMDDMKDLIDLAVSRAIHIHARVGYEEGPQVPDPRAPEFQPYVERHETWWDAIRENLKSSGAEILTLTPEFGPPHYMHTLPYTRQPVASLWEVCLYMKDRVTDRWK